MPSLLLVGSSEPEADQGDRAGGDQPERDGAEGRAPRLWRGRSRPAGELDEHPADAAAHADRHLGDDRAEHRVGRGEPQRGQQVRHARPGSRSRSSVGH